MSFTRLLLKHAFCCLPQTRGTLQQLLRDRSKEDPTLLISYSYIKHLKSPLSRRSTGTHRPSFLHHSECPALKQQNIHKKKKNLSWKLYSKTRQLVVWWREVRAHTLPFYTEKNLSPAGIFTAHKKCYTITTSFPIKAKETLHSLTDYCEHTGLSLPLQTKIPAQHQYVSN